MDLERRLRALDVLQRSVLRVRVRVVKNGVAMAERPALGVLTGEPDRRPLADQRGERETFGEPPIDFALAGERRLTSAELRRQFPIDREALGPISETAKSEVPWSITRN